jgi:hypothetical protein
MVVNNIEQEDLIPLENNNNNIDINEINNQRIAAFKAALLRAKMLKSLEQNEDSKQSEQSEQSEQSGQSEQSEQSEQFVRLQRLQRFQGFQGLRPNQFMIPQVALTEDEKLIQEIREGSMNQIKREFASKVPIQLKWSIEL